MKIVNKFKSIINNIKVNKQINKLIDYAKADHKESVKILFAPGFNINMSFTYHDTIIASLLHAKGAKIHYTSGHDRLMTPLMFGGVWSSGSQKLDFSKLRNGEKKARSFFDKLGEVSTMEDIVTTNDVQHIYNNIKKLDVNELLNYSLNGIDLGHDAANRLRNLDLVSDITLIKDYEEKLKLSLVNCIVYCTYFENIINKFNPDRIFSHESFYYPWSIMQKLAYKNKIDFYNYYPAVRKNAYIYAKGQHALLLDMNNIWNSIKDAQLSIENKEKILSLINGERKNGNTGILKQIRNIDEEENRKIIKYMKEKPTAVLYGNVCWDLCALDKEIFFKSIKSAYIETIEFFIKNPQYQLIIKSHPDEENPKIPVTVEKLENICKSEFNILPDNIKILMPSAPVTAYDLIPFSKCSIVYTTTVGLESTIFGTPVLTIANAHYRGKGFTFDPLNKNEYFGTNPSLLGSI